MLRCDLYVCRDFILKGAIPTNEAVKLREDLAEAQCEVAEAKIILHENEKLVNEATAGRDAAAREIMTMKKGVQLGFIQNVSSVIEKKLRVKPKKKDNEQWLVVHKLKTCSSEIVSTLVGPLFAALPNEDLQKGGP